MKLLLTTCLLLIWTSSTASAQQSGKAAGMASTKASGETRRVPGVGRTETKHASLTREQMREAEARLFEMGYWTRAVDEAFDPATRSALIAFQKWEGRTITGRLTIAELEAIRNSADSIAKDSWPKARETGYAHVEVDLDRQVLLVVNEEGGVKVLPVSTGSDMPFIEDGQQSISYTPRGRFVVYEKSVGWEKGSNGLVYYPNAISGGVAIHGSRIVPNQPASHGCIRIPIFAARKVSKLLKVGTIVLVYESGNFCLDEALG